MECALTSPRFGARAAPGLGEGRLGALRRPRLRRRGRGGAPGAAIHWLERLATPLGERPEAWASVPNRPGRGSRDSEVSATRKLLTNRRCLTRPSRPCNQVLTTLSRVPPLLGLDAPPRLLCPRGEWALLPPLFFPLLFPSSFFLASPSRPLACLAACCLPACGPAPPPPNLSLSFTVCFF